MIPQFILDTCAIHIMTSSGDAYYFSTVDRDGWVMYWPEHDETFHTYRDPADWAVDIDRLL